MQGGRTSYSQCPEGGRLLQMAHSWVVRSIQQSLLSTNNLRIDLVKAPQSRFLYPLLALLCARWREREKTSRNL